MESQPRRLWVYWILFAAWALIFGWQVLEHRRIETAAKKELRNRAKDISTTVGIVLRSQRRFGVISKERIEPALAGLVRPNELSAVALLNTAGDIVASAPTNSDLKVKSTSRQPELWESDSVTIMNLVDLGSTVSLDSDNTNPPIVISRESFPRSGETNRPPPDREFRPPSAEGSKASVEFQSGTNRNRGSRAGEGDDGVPPHTHARPDFTASRQDSPQ